jgi:hypothetical protein
LVTTKLYAGDAQEGTDGRIIRRKERNHGGYERLLTCTTAGSRQKHMEEGDEEWLEEKAHYIRPM